MKSSWRKQELKWLKTVWNQDNKLIIMFHVSTHFVALFSTASAMNLMNSARIDSACLLSSLAVTVSFSDSFFASFRAGCDMTFLPDSVFFVTAITRCTPSLWQENHLWNACHVHSNIALRFLCMGIVLVNSVPCTPLHKCDYAVCILILHKRDGQKKGTLSSFLQRSLSAGQLKNSVDILNSSQQLIGFWWHVKWGNIRCYFNSCCYL